jgi:release factor glutamine methyltransferase
MMDSVQQYEPIEALESDDLGYKDLFYIINNASQWLVPGGYIALEHGFLQQKAVKKVLEECCYSSIYLGRDQINPRFIIAARP